jgi:hypothetical protein
MVQHTLPEGRPGASLDEAAARALAVATLRKRYGLDVARGQAREVSAHPQKLKARTDWTFTYVDATVPPLPQGEPRIEITLAGDEVAGSGRFVYVPEEWRRQERAAATRNTVLQVLVSVLFGGLLVGAAVSGVIAWSRRQYTPRLFVAAGSVMLAASLARFLNSWPTVLATIPTAVPLTIAILGVIGIGIVGLLLTSSLVGLALGAQPQRMTQSARLADAVAVRVGLSVGFFGAAIAAAAGWLKLPVWARVPDLTALGTTAPVLHLAVDPIVSLLTRTAVVLATLVTIDRMTAGWTRRRAAAVAAIAVIGFFVSAPAGLQLRGWMLAGGVTALGFLVAVVGAFRFDLTMVPLALGAMTVLGVLMRGAQRPFPGALIGSIVAAIVVALAAWWMFKLLRRNVRTAGS